MNTTDRLIAEVYRYGAALYVDGDRLKATPPGRLPSHLQAELRAAAAAVKDRLLDETDRERLARIGGWTPAPAAKSIVATCQHHGVALRIDPTTGDLIVGKAGAKADEPTQPWPSLLIVIEAHLEAVAALVASGWSLQAEFPERGAA